MTDLLCKWLNDEIQVSEQITPASFAKQFSSGYLLGEILHKNQLQDDFDHFSHSRTSDAKLNNFTRLKPMFHLLGIPFDATVARDMMTEKYGTATRLLYQVYVALNNKKNANLTQIAMKTLQAAAPAKLGGIEKEMFKERLKKVTPRQTELDLQALISRFHEHQIRMEQKKFKEAFEETERLQQQREKERKRLMDRSRELREKQIKLVANINAENIQLLKPPPNQTPQAIQARKELRKKKEAEETINDIHQFEQKFKAILPPNEDSCEFDIQYFLKKAETHAEPAFVLKLAPFGEYMAKIHKRLQEDAVAREERENRRRKVLNDQMNAHLGQEEARREEIMVSRLLRQSQQERRIAVQLMQARREKEVIRQNRILREKQHQERREKDFQDALDKEAENAYQTRQEYACEIKAQQVLHNQILAQRAENRYTRHYNICSEIVNSIVDFASKVAEYRDLTNKLLPAKLMREWTLLFVKGQPLFEPVVEEVDDMSPELILEEERKQLLDEGDFLDYRSMNGEWQPPEKWDIKEPPGENPVLVRVIKKLFNMAHPPSPPPTPPLLPSFSIRACVLGKVFSGKTTCLKQLALERNIELLVPEYLVQEAIEAYKNGEVETADVEVQVAQTEELDYSSSIHDLDSTLELEKKEYFEKISAHAEPEKTHEVPEEDSLTAVNLKTYSPALRRLSSAEAKDKQQLPSAEIQEKQRLSTAEIKDKPVEPEPTVRAKLGSKAMKSLKKGRPVDDQVMVDILMETIRKIPNGKGWILEGYPQTYNQAKLLEKALSGCDAKDSKKTQKPGLITNPLTSTQASIPPSGIDVVILFDIRDELCLKRAIGRFEYIQAEETFHEEINPPPEGSFTGVGKVQKVYPVADLNNDEQQIQKRLIAFLDNWPKLQKWLMKYGTLKVVDASLEKESVFLETEKIIEDIIERFVPRYLQIQNKNKPEVVEFEEVQEQKEHPPGGPPEAAPAEEPVEVPAPGGPEDRTRPLSKTSSKTQREPVTPALGSGASRDSKQSKKSLTEEAKRTFVKPSVEKVSGEDKPEQKEKQEIDVEFNVIISVDLGFNKSSGSPREKKSRSPKSKKPESVSPKRKGNRGGAHTAGQKKPAAGGSKEQEPETEVTVPSPPKPGDNDWIFSEFTIDEELAKVLMLLWEEIENTYINNLKTVFRNIREERENIYRYFFKIRKDFVQYLQKPDCKQEFVKQWQKVYNEVPDDLRDDDEMRAELHQKVCDLVERLWNICDNRKEQAEAEKLAIQNEGWLEDRIGILTNHFFTIMQAEVDLFQDTVRLLKDYYQGMDGTIPVALNPRYERLPLIELPFVRPEKIEKISSTVSITGEEASKAITPDPLAHNMKTKKSFSSKEGEKTSEKSEEEITQKTVIPLVPRYVFHAESESKLAKLLGKESKDKVHAKRVKEETSTDSLVQHSEQDDKQIYEGYFMAVSAVAQINQAEIMVKEAEEAAEKLKEQEKEKMEKKAPKLKKLVDTKKGVKKEETSATMIVEPTESNHDELEKKLTKFRAREEVYFAIQEQTQATITRLELVYVKACAILKCLKTNGEDSFKAMDDWLGAKFLKEMESIDQMRLVLCNAIEHSEKLKHEIILEMDNFLLDEDLKVLRTPSPEPSPSPVEEPMTNHFTVDQLKKLYEQLSIVAPTGIISKKGFIDKFENLTLVNQEIGLLPELWMHLTSSQIQELANALFCNSEYVDWHRLLVALCYPIPTPTQQDLLTSLQRFKNMDQRESGTVTREQWDWIRLWFYPDQFPGTQYYRVLNLKKLLFEMFADHSDEISLLDYVKLLMYFSATANYHEGFLRALSVATGQHIPRLDKPLLKPPVQVRRPEINASGIASPKEESKTIVEPPMSDEVIPHSAYDSEVSLEALFKVLHHGDINGGDSHRFAGTEEPGDHRSIEKLTAVFRELNDDDSTAPIMYRVLIEHPLIQDIVFTSKQYKALDLKFLMSDPTATDIPEASSHQLLD